MTNKLAIYIAIVIVAVFLLDHFYLHQELHIFLGRKLAELSDYIAFWR